MHSTRIVTSFLRNDEEFLILKRSSKVKSMKGLWAGISGLIENNEEPLKRAEIEIFEEVGIKKKNLKLIKSGESMKIKSIQYDNHEWEIFPFLFDVENPKINLNWENSDYKWIKIEDLQKFDTVPSLDQVLINLL
ncbi:MAG: NUDIX domain-containing protein [Nitrosopumilus sp.]